MSRGSLLPIPSHSAVGLQSIMHDAVSLYRQKCGMEWVVRTMDGLLYASAPNFDDFDIEFQL